MAQRNKTAQQNRRSPGTPAPPAPPRGTPSPPPGTSRTNATRGTSPGPSGENSTRPGRLGSPSYAAMVVRGPTLGPSIAETPAPTVPAQPVPANDVLSTAQPAETTAAITAPSTSTPTQPQQPASPQPARVESPEAQGEPPVQDKKRKKKVNKGKARAKPMIPIGSGHPPGVAKGPVWETDEYQRHVSESRKRRRVTDDNLPERTPSPPARVQNSPGPSFAQTAATSGKPEFPNET
ncbi:uncharacterized protein B0H18DRAFT_1126583 [Fomitopsis serialis]|uniref:uncharacterized protein n=1 Tax=Fomitopsis serialis TaxID=139415 RepID=UPI002007B0A6|nr:uncharacterized protein B0H18DRAFT_1126583 [Neoantrodia serialis]KAH9913051.1 hypothetical protein B0H18DRAFT_1126583 [Neoantrodia serialis]